MDEQAITIKYVDDDCSPIEEIDWDIYQGICTEEVYTAEGELSYLIMHCHKYTDAEIALIKIPELKQKLSDTDYVVSKMVESQVTGVPIPAEDAERYASILEQRQQWRDEINELESQLEQEQSGSV